MEAMEMESERSLRRKQATYTSLVNTLLFLFYSILTPSISVLPTLPSVWLLRNRGKNKKKIEVLPRPTTMVLKSPAPRGYSLVSNNPDCSVDFLIFDDGFDKLLLLFCDFEFGIVDYRTSSFRFRRRRTGASSTARFTLLVSTWCEPFSVPSFPIWNPIYPVTFASKSSGNL